MTVGLTNSGPLTKTAGEALEAHRRVKISASTLVYADAGEACIGVTTDKFASGAMAAFTPINTPGLVPVTAADSFSAGADLYGAADGKVSDSASGDKIGVAWAAATADGGIVSACLASYSPADNLLTPMDDTIVWEDDFITGCTEDGQKFSETADKGDWLLTVVDTDSDSGEVCQVADDAPGGWLTLTSNDNALDSGEIQLNGESFKLAVGTTLRFDARIAVADVDKTDWFVGLAIADTTSHTGTSDRVGFECDHDANIDALVEQDTTESRSDTTSDIADGTIATAATTAVTLSFEWDGVSAVKFYVDGVLKSTKTDNGTTIVIPDDEALTPTFCLQNSEAAAESMYVDYVKITTERI